MADFWYTADIDTIDYGWDSGEPDILRLTKYYKEVRFQPVINQLRVRVNQSGGSGDSILLSQTAELNKVKYIEDPDDIIINPPADRGYIEETED